ncbi:hypothetical protein CEUSTIGMA_g9540.t1 [Chlamydomonas eustigma]|uniref:ABC transporter domain-containing protein n=1 Tax=Chlamydomonas eustigma TaxID=1157962 RepID=A0A250XGR3_9CHLO|nr:hypothetical protein CEUSTIGMA_g9540.t1 [Chlamydomonas eustigma]|eukprot:GAX82112.1 hypothetical protein CEUSTIGMA_g9540.t1 [Chlamydomonas eustigma]
MSSSKSSILVSPPAALLELQPSQDRDMVLATITWNKLTVVAKDSKGETKELLKGVSGFLEPSRMLAIMGPSGCGKTTLLNTLAGRQPKSVGVTGQILLNGHTSFLGYGKAAYVTQDEMMVGTLTVREYLTYTALLRLPSTWSYEEKMVRVLEVLDVLGLLDASNTFIGNWFLKGISGGQKRRLAIACELLTHPTMMFLDEPTSGLDAASAFFVMDAVSKLAKQGRTIVTVIHQPSSEVFELFDQLCLLSTGRLVYFGDASDALSLFEEAGLPCPMLRNPTDHFLHVINEDFKEADSEDHVHKVIHTFNQRRLVEVEKQVALLSTVGAPYVGNENKASFMYQVYVLTKRTFENNTRNIGVFWLRLGMYIMLCIMIGTIYLRLGYSWKDSYSRTAMMFFIAAFLTFMAIAGFPAFAEDLAVFQRERMNGYYGVATFAIANTLASAPFLFLISILSSVTVYWLVNLNSNGDRFPYFFINLYTSLTVVESMMMAMAAIVPHYLMGIAGGAGVLGMYMLVCGFFQPVGQLPAPVWRYPMHYIAFHSYTFGGFMQNEFSGTEGWGCACYSQTGGCPPPYNASNLCTISGQEVLDYWVSGAGTLNKWVDIGIQWGMVIIYRSMFFGLLKLYEFLQQQA